MSGSSRHLRVPGLAGAVKVAQRIEFSGTIVFVVCDYGWKYLSTGASRTLDLDEATANAEKVIYF